MHDVALLLSYIHLLHSRFISADFSATDEVIPPLPIQQYEDYIRECQDIQQSFIIRNKEEGRVELSRSNSTKSTG